EALPSAGLEQQQELISQTDQLGESSAALFTTEQADQEDQGDQAQQPQLEQSQEIVGTTEFMLSEQSITQEHLCDDAVGSSQLQSGAVQAKHLAFQPVRSVSKQPVVQQFGMEAFVLSESEVCTEVTVVFEEPFASEHYVIVGM
ncbi:WIAG-tail domain, partial [Clostridioides difficile]